MTEGEKLYFKWLLDRVCNDYQEMDYSELLKELHEKEFVWVLEKDENRAEDGKYLRDEWRREADDVRVPSKFFTKSCSVLEMMVALSERCEDIMGDLDQGDRSYIWFWKMIDNMGLNDETNYRIDYEHVDAVIDRMMHRDYDRNGANGCLFTVPGTRKDLRKLEIWYQMHTWLNTMVDY